MLEIVKTFGPVLIFLLGLWAMRFPRRAEMRKHSYVEVVAEWRKAELAIMSLPFKLRKDLEKAGFASVAYFDRKEEHKQISMAVLNDFAHSMEGYTIATEKILLSASPELRKELINVEKLAGQMRFKAVGWIDVEMMGADEHYNGFLECREAVLNLRRGTIRAKVIMHAELMGAGGLVSLFTKCFCDKNANLWDGDFHDDLLVMIENEQQSFRAAIEAKMSQSKGVPV